VGKPAAVSDVCWARCRTSCGGWLGEHSERCFELAEHRIKSTLATPIGQVVGFERYVAGQVVDVVRRAEKYQSIVLAVGTPHQPFGVSVEQLQTAEFGVLLSRHVDHDEGLLVQWSGRPEIVRTGLPAVDDTAIVAGRAVPVDV